MRNSISSSETPSGCALLAISVHRLLVALAVVALAGCIAMSDNVTERGGDSCHVAGCSAQVCSDRDDVVTTCEWRDVYECYLSASCERQSDGACGWTPTQELNACLARHSP
jgi:eight-cysteine-cluster-containing protein